MRGLGHLGILLCYTTYAAEYIRSVGRCWSIIGPPEISATAFAEESTTVIMPLHTKLPEDLKEVDVIVSIPKHDTPLQLPSSGLYTNKRRRSLEVHAHTMSNCH